MAAAPGDERERLLDPVDRISEVLFGLIMAMTIIGSLSIASAGAAEVRTVTIAALGCNVAWGLVDAVMYVVRAATERARLRTLAHRIRTSDAATGARIIARILPDELAAVVGPEEIAGMRRRVLALPEYRGKLLHPRDFLEAFAIFAMVVLATFPLVLPFFVVTDTTSAMRISQGVSVGMLVLCGAALGRHAGRARPVFTGACMGVFGAVLIVIVKALGG